MRINKVCYLGGSKDKSLMLGEIYTVSRTILKSDGRTLFVLEGVEGEHDKTMFHKLENGGRHYLINKGGVPEVGEYMRLVTTRNGVNEFMTGVVKIVEKSLIPGVYRAYTEKAMYEVSSVD